MPQFQIIRKVPFRLPPKNRLVWGIELAHHEGVSLLFIRKPDENYRHALVTATENVTERVFESVSLSHFPLEDREVEMLGDKLQMLGSSLGSVDLDELFRRDFE
jgi:hypothetical protein